MRKSLDDDMECEDETRTIAKVLRWSGGSRSARKSVGTRTQRRRDEKEDRGREVVDETRSERDLTTIRGRWQGRAGEVDDVGCGRMAKTCMKLERGENE